MSKGEIKNLSNYMRKIKTIFERVDGKVIDSYTVPEFPHRFDMIATEKLDGMNVRATIRGATCVRLEKRRNPDKIQKHKGIIEPWYTDTSESAEDKWLLDALKHTDLSKLPDGEWSGEALGPNIQGNPLNLENNRIVFFTLHQAPIFENVPQDFAGLKEWLPNQNSKYGNNCGIEGIVWHCSDGEMYKIKTRDF
jgi:hypothetical protein